jgi:plasmid stability protein
VDTVKRLLETDVASKEALAEQQRCMQNAAVPSITIRDVPDETRDELAARAARSGHSLQEFLRRQLIELAAKPDVESLMARIRHRKQASECTIDVETILEYRDADRR